MGNDLRRFERVRRPSRLEFLRRSAIAGAGLAFAKGVTCGE